MHFRGSKTYTLQSLLALRQSWLWDLMVGLQTLTDTSTLLLAITTTDFVSALVITSNSLSCLLPLTRSLQAESKDIVEAVEEIRNLKDTLSDMREKLDEVHGKWFEEIEKMCESVGVQPSFPRLYSRQRHRSNVPAQTPLEYY